MAHMIRKLWPSTTLLPLQKNVIYYAADTVQRLAESERARKSGITQASSVMESLSTLYLAPGPSMPVPQTATIPVTEVPMRTDIPATSSSKPMSEIARARLRLALMSDQDILLMSEGIFPGNALQSITAHVASPAFESPSLEAERPIPMEIPSPPPMPSDPNALFVPPLPTERSSSMSSMVGSPAKATSQ